MHLILSLRIKLFIQPLLSTTTFVSAISYSFAYVSCLSFFQLHIENNAALPEEAFRVFSERGDLQAMATTLSRELLNPLVMKGAMVKYL